MRSPRAGAILALAVALGCAAGDAHHVDERAAGYAHPEPDPACRGTVQQLLVLGDLEQVTVRVAVAPRRPVAVEILAPPLSPAQAEEVRRAFAECAWRPGAGGATSGVVTIGRAR